MSHQIFLIKECKQTNATQEHIAEITRKGVKPDPFVKNAVHSI